MTEAITWIALAILSAPVWLDWAEHAITHSWASYVLVFPILTLIWMRRVPRGRRHVALGIFLATVGIAIQLWALASVSVRNGRPGLILCIFGVLLTQGRAPGRGAVPLLLCVAIPSAVLSKLDGDVVPLLARLLAEVSRGLGIPAIAIGRSLEWPERIVVLDATDLGVSAALLAAGLAWFGCWVARFELGRSVWISMLAAFGAAALHFGITLMMLGLAGSPIDAGDRTQRDFLVYGIVILAVALVVAIATCRRSRSDPEHVPRASPAPRPGNSDA
jgi:hypothetical protein